MNTTFPPQRIWLQRTPQDMQAQRVPPTKKEVPSSPGAGAVLLFDCLAPKLD
jgi:hypothetical protein